MKKKVNIKDTRFLTILAMLLAISVVLGIHSIRIGSGIKISFKFVSVFVTSALFGPLYGGVCGFLSDLLAYLFNPAGGAYMPQIGLVEALYGISFGLFFYNKSGVNLKNTIRLLICLVLNSTILSLGLMSYFLSKLMVMTYLNTLIMRVPSTIINTLIHFTLILVILKVLPKFKTYLN